MSNKFQTSIRFRNQTAVNKAARAYRKQFDIGLDGEPRRRGKRPVRARKETDL